LLASTSYGPKVEDAIAVAIYVGDPLNVVRKVVATGPPQPVPLELHDEPFAGFPEVAVSGVQFGGVELSD
jgi:hypothetical protein